MKAIQTNSKLKKSMKIAVRQKTREANKINKLSYMSWRPY